MKPTEKKQSSIKASDPLDINALEDFLQELGSLDKLAESTHNKSSNNKESNIAPSRDSAYQHVHGVIKHLHPDIQKFIAECELVNKAVPNDYGDPDNFIVVKIAGFFLAVEKQCNSVLLSLALNGGRDIKKLIGFLRASSLKNIDPKAIALATSGQMSSGKEVWWCIARASVPVQAKHKRLVFLPDRHSVSEAIKQGNISSLILRIKKMQIMPPVLFNKAEPSVSVAQGEVICRLVHEQSVKQDGCDVFGNPLPCPEIMDDVLPSFGNYIQLSGNELIAERYGYLVYEDERLTITSPLLVDAKGMQVSWMLFDPMPCKITPEMILPWLLDMKVGFGIQKDLIKQFCKAISLGSHTSGIFAIASAVAPIHGKDAELITTVNPVSIEGVGLEDGKIDFSAIESATYVKVGQLLAVKTAYMPGIDGTDVYGNKLAAKKGRELEITVEKGIRVEKKGDTEEFYATIDGLFRKDGNTIAVKPALIFDSTHPCPEKICFDGDVFIIGNVAPSCQIEATGDIVATENIEEDATIISTQGNIFVGNGIIGAQTFVSSNADVTAKFVHEATVNAKGDVWLGNFAYRAKIHVRGSIIIAKGEGKHGGCVIGGELIALKDIDVRIAGTSSWFPTFIGIGIVPALEKLQEEAELKTGQCANFIRKALKELEIDSLDAEKLKKAIINAKPEKKLAIIELVQKLQKVTSAYKNILAKRQGIETLRKDALSGAGSLYVREELYPGVTVAFGSFKKEITEEKYAVKFSFLKEKMVESDIT